MIKIALVQFPGSNCERETALAVKRAGMEPVEFLWNETLDKLRSMDGFILIGGFSYEDRSRAGIIAALDPVIQEIKTQSEQGKPVLGICNGAQILIEAGLVPGLGTNEELIALTENKRITDDKIIGTGFYNAWSYIRLATSFSHNAFTRYLTTKDLIYLPIAHAEGRFLISDTLLKEFDKQGLHLFQYCDAQGQIVNNFPVNPNGSVANIAAICNKAGNIMAMMPHPERTINGDPIFRSMHDYIREASKEKLIPIYSPKKVLNPPPFPKIATSKLYLIKLIITDNQALTVQKTLRQLGFPVLVERFEHWEIEAETLESLALLKTSELLYSERKEHEVSSEEFYSASGLAYLVRPKEDLKGQQILQTLKAHYEIPGIQKIKHGIVWRFKTEGGNLADLIDKILLTNIIGNQYAHEYYIYDHA